MENIFNPYNHEFNAICAELDEILARSQIVKRNLREHSGFAIEMHYRLIVNFIALGAYSKIEYALENLSSHPQLIAPDYHDILRTTKELLKCAYRLDTLHKHDVESSRKTVDVITFECHMFGNHFGEWLRK
ncbi:hypothetical protein NVP1081O_320 [Vibrio phage 1.081.O._10N.286.52.C2]|nr:hypothetical protein NVP1081O_320 [Vibrio phage 1.081.O._10N.286.52.C2]